NQTLERLADTLAEKSQEILAANKKDLNDLPAKTPPAFRDRLLLNNSRLDGMRESLRQVAKLPDPVGEVFEEKKLVNGLRVHRVRAPLGLIFMIFQSRPNVILEAFSLAYKSGNAILLRGGSESRHTSQAIYKLMRECFSENPPFHGIEDYDRALVKQ